jgi:opacity protein-like surface antigen
MTRFTDSRALRLAALVALSLGSSVAAAGAADMPDMPWLRGTVGNDSPGYMRWDGVQFGAQIGLSNLSGDFASSSNPQVAYILRNSTLEDEFSPSTWSTLPKATSNGRQFGGFLGYNMQWDRLVIGGDIGYNRMQSLEAASADSLDRIVTTSDGVRHDVLIDSSSSLKLVDYGTFRARAGYAFGQFLPYAVVGGAVGRFNYASTSTVTDRMSGALTGTFQQSASDARNNVFAAGFVAGLGADVALLPNVFLRAEWEYTFFSPVNGIRSQLNTGRVGLGIRF